MASLIVSSEVYIQHLVCVCVQDCIIKDSGLVLFLSSHLLGLLPASLSPDMDPSELENEEDDGMTYQEMVKRDKRRWEAADRDEDSALTIEEFMDFLHPEEADHMSPIVVLETMEDIDKDKDGKISLAEYIG